jgi:hypothetical protein
MSTIFDTNTYKGIWMIILLTLLCLFITIILGLSIYDTVQFGNDTSKTVEPIDSVLFFFKTFFVDYILFSITGPFIFIKNMLVSLISNFFTNMTTNIEYRTCFLKYGLFYGFICILFAVLYIGARDPAFFSSKVYVYLFFIVTSLIALIYFVIPFAKNSNNGLLSIISVGSIITFIACVIYYYTSLNSPTAIFISYIINTIIALGIIAALAIFFYLFSNYLKSSTGLLGFLIYFIFYIPCLLIDFTKYIINEFRMTTNVVYVLFILEIILVLLYIYVPQLISYIVKSDGTVLLSESKFLNKETILSNSDPFKMTDLEKEKIGMRSEFISNTIFRREYSISMWVYINTQLNNTKSYAKEVPIFCYGSDNINTGKPKITYIYNNSDGNTDKLIIYFTDSTASDATYEYTIQKQKWINIVLNYISNRADLFINGNLVKSFPFDINEPDYENIDKIFIGSKNGVDGAICNVQYLNKPQTKQQIVNKYNLLMNRNPPTEI